MLSATGREFSFEGSFYRTAGAPTAPGPVQRPRPPLTVGGQSPTVRRVAAERADCWNTHGPFGRSVDDIVEVTGEQNRELDEHCARLGRDPRALRRALLLYGPLDPWSTGADPVELVDRFHAVGMREFVLFWPPEGGLDRLAPVAEALIAPTRR